MRDTGGGTERPDAKPVHPQSDKSGKGTDQRDGCQTRDPKAADRIVDQPDRLTDYDSDEDGLEVGSFTPKPPGGGFLASERRRSSLDGDGRRSSDSGNDKSPDESSADSARLDAERSALAAAKRGGEDVVAA
ncbi:MAG: hypothetical protein ACPG7T_06855, partial [Ilumatobacteraceae bacterium]